MTDRYHYSDESGKEKREKNDFNLPLRHAQWTTSWQVDFLTPGGVDREGWQYSFDVRIKKCIFTCLQRHINNFPKFFTSPSKLQKCSKLHRNFLYFKIPLFVVFSRFCVFSNKKINKNNYLQFSFFLRFFVLYSHISYMYYF